MGIYIDTKYGNLDEDLTIFFEHNNIKTCFDYDSQDEKTKCILALILLNNRKYKIVSEYHDSTSNLKLFKDVEDYIKSIEKQYNFPIISVLYKNDNDLINYLTNLSIVGTTKFQFKTNMMIRGTLSSVMNLENDADTYPKSEYGSYWRTEIYNILSSVFINHEMIKESHG
jgi:hypothetical protein